MGGDKPLFDVAVVIPTVIRPTITRALRSIFAQTNVGRIQVLIGVDRRVGSPQILQDAIAEAPAHVDVLVIDPGYSTSARHGGVYPAFDGGALRTALSYLAHSRYVCYLDDDNWFAPGHLSSMLASVRGQDWAFSYRVFVYLPSGRRLIDRIESMGPGKGSYARNFGGFVDPNCLILDKVACDAVLRLWTKPLLRGRPDGRAADRRVFDALLDYPHYGKTGKATVFYMVRPRKPRRRTTAALAKEPA